MKITTVVLIILVILAFIAGASVQLSLYEKDSLIVCPEAYIQDSVILPTRFGKLDEADINGTKWTVVWDEESHKVFLHVSQGSIYELGRVK